ncbi:MAG: hypothetical protein MK132_01655 [Lentisphaerales bacterium]|nr:hypothetical protein [Lentisphaerales bacterium]
MNTFAKLFLAIVLTAILSGCHGHYDDCPSWHIDIDLYEDCHDWHHHPRGRHCH